MFNVDYDLSSWRYVVEVLDNKGSPFVEDWREGVVHGNDAFVGDLQMAIVRRPGGGGFNFLLGRPRGSLSLGSLASSLDGGILVLVEVVRGDLRAVSGARGGKELPDHFSFAAILQPLEDSGWEFFDDAGDGCVEPVPSPKILFDERIQDADSPHSFGVVTRRLALRNDMVAVWVFINLEVNRTSTHSLREFDLAVVLMGKAGDRHAGDVRVSGFRH